MHCSCTKFTRMSQALFGSLLFVALSMPAGAQQGWSPSTVNGFGPAYDAMHEITLVGTIQQVVTSQDPGSPVGMHLLITGPQGVVDACIGPFLSKQTKDALQDGVSVQFIGSTMQLHDKEYFLVRELMVGGNSTVIRTRRGFLVDRRGNGAAGMKQTAISEVKGGHE